MLPIVFDLDGTLIDSAPDIHGIANAVLADIGQEPLTLAASRDFVGNGASVFVEKMRAARGIPDDDHERLLAAFMDRYQSAFGLTLPYQGVREALDDLVTSGHRLGICTNKPMGPTTGVLRHLEMEGYFGAVYGGDSLKVRKPDPAPLHAAFEALGGTGLYVGDSEVDAETADRAGVPFLLYTEGYRKSPTEEMVHIATFSDWAAFPALVASLAR